MHSTLLLQQTTIDQESRPSFEKNSAFAKYLAGKLRIIAEKKAKSSKISTAHHIPIVEKDAISLGALLGTGSFGSAYEIKCISGLKVNDPYKDLALKKLNMNVIRRSDPRVFARCAADMVEEGRILASLNHPNIISIHAWSGPDMIEAYINGSTSPGYLILDRLEETLVDRLQSWRKRCPKMWHLRSKRKQKDLSVKHEKYHAILSLSRAVKYLHEKRILHRDLKPANIGYGRDGSLKVFDFDIATVLPRSRKDKLFRMTQRVGSPRYMAPEVARGDAYNLKADVYSFGLIVYEILSLTKPFIGMNRETINEKVYCGTFRPPVEKKWPQSIKEVMDGCWQRQVSSRLSMAQVVSMLVNQIIPEVVGDLKQLKIPVPGNAKIQIAEKEAKRISVIAHAA